MSSAQLWARRLAGRLWHEENIRLARMVCSTLGAWPVVVAWAKYLACTNGLFNFGQGAWLVGCGFPAWTWADPSRFDLLTFCTDHVTNSKDCCFYTFPMHQASEFQTFYPGPDFLIEIPLGTGGYTTGHKEKGS
eukprot:1159077-Pelagomonas_calceolata.AAC.6